MGDTLNILLMSRYFPPEIGTAVNLFFDLALGLAQNGHTVTVVTGFPWYNLSTLPERYSRKFFMKEILTGSRWSEGESLSVALQSLSSRPDALLLLLPLFWALFYANA